MGALRNTSIHWPVNGRTLVFETTPGRAGGVFRCSACRRGMNETELPQALDAFHLHKCAKERHDKRRKPVLKA